MVEGNGIIHYKFVPMTPNALTEQSLKYEIPRNPKVADNITKIPLLGTAGVAINGLPIFGPNEGQMPHPFGDPILNAIMDECLGHTAFVYHYHGLVERCLLDASTIDAKVDSSKASPILGYALDGFPIYGERGCLDKECSKVVSFKSSFENEKAESVGCKSNKDCSKSGYRCGKMMVKGEQKMACAPETYAWDNNKCTKESCKEAKGEFLDECNGRTQPDGSYGYHVTQTFPYILSCYRGTPKATNQGGGQNSGGGNNGGNTGNGNMGGSGNSPTGGTATGPASCSSTADCNCPNTKLGCICSQNPQGQKSCIPKCNSNSDCPTGQRSLRCDNQRGFCVPN